MNVFVEGAEGGYVGGSVADDEFGAMAAELVDYGFGGGEGGYVSLEDVDAGEGLHGLEIDCDYGGGWWCVLFVVVVVVVVVLVRSFGGGSGSISIDAQQSFGKDLAPSSGSGAQIDGSSNNEGLVHQQRWNERRMIVIIVTTSTFPSLLFAKQIKRCINLQ